MCVKVSTLVHIYICTFLFHGYTVFVESGNLKSMHLLFTAQPIFLSRIINDKATVSLLVETCRSIDGRAIVSVE